MPGASIRTRLMAALLALALVPLTIVAIVSYETSQDILKENASAKLEELAAQTMERIDRVLFARSQDMQAWASMEALQDVIADDPEGRISVTLVRLWSRYGHSASIYCLNQLGQIVASNEVSLLGRSVARESWFRLGSLASGLVVNDLAYDPLTHTLVVRLMVPIVASHDDQTVIGYLVAHVPHGELQEIIQQVKVHEGGHNRTGHVLLVNGRGALIAGPAFMVDAAPIPKFPSTTVAQVGYLPSGKRPTTPRGAYLTENSHMLVGFAHSTGYRTYAGLDWMTLVAQDSTEAFGQIKMLRREFLGLFLVTTLLVLLVAYAMSRSISIPIQSLTNLANRIAEGDLSQTITVASKDEVGALASSFNRMTEDLRRSRDELVRTNHELVMARDRALEVSRLKSHFLANMSHEIRTPMNGILGMTELMLATGLNERQRRLADTVNRSGRALLQIINDILDFSKIEAGKLELERVVFDPRQLVEETVDMFAERAQRKGLALLCSMADTVPPTLVGDPGRLRQILINLLGNAIKFTERGEVGVRFISQDDTPPHVVVQCTVSDTGIGIPLEAQQDIFEAFSQADSSYTRRYGGTGLGLSIVRQLVSLMHGSIAVQSEPGQGAHFTFTARFERPDGQEPGAASRSVALSARRMMIVERRITVRDTLMQQLTAWGILPMAVSSGEEALSALRSALTDGLRYDLAILGGDEPEVELNDLARAIKTDPAIAGVPLVLITSTEQADRRRALVPSEYAACLHSSVTPSALFDCLVSVLTRTTWTQQRIDAQDTRKSPESEQAPQSSLPRARILIAEDNEVNQEVARLMLEQAGQVVSIAANGREALEALSREPYDLIFMDCQMPEMDGFAATRAIRARESQHPEFPRIPIVALTAHAIQGDHEQCQAAGMDDYLSKPFSQEQLVAKLRHWVSHRDGLPLGRKEDTYTCEPPAPASHQTLPSSASLIEGPTLVPTDGSERATVDRKFWKDILSLQQPGRPDVLVTMLSIFLKDSDQLLSQLRQAVERRDAKTVFELAHSLKSRSGILGAVKLAELCKELEQAGRNDNLASAPEQFTLLFEEFVGVAECFRAELARRNA